ncbi:MAG TPA: ABC transporter ATP-binding protein [Bacilli bacterium]|nr:ABC transporter ATP-binding protein [Bacilli bacterium]
MFVEVTNVSKVYQTGEVSYQALKGVDLSVEQGQVCVILGPSGSGKSTLLNAIGGIDTVEDGTITIGGKTLTAMDDRQLTEYRREDIGFVFQYYNLIPNLTVAENVEVVTEIAAAPLSREEVLKAVGLWEFKDRFPSELSGGQQQRVSIARAVVKNPKLLLCDEPTGALDYETSKEILKLLQTINREYGTTILIITHNQAISAMAHRVVRLRSGEIIENRLNDHILSPERMEW